MDSRLIIWPGTIGLVVEETLDGRTCPLTPEPTLYEQEVVWVLEYPICPSVRFALREFVVHLVMIPDLRTYLDCRETKDRFQLPRKLQGNETLTLVQGLAAERSGEGRGGSRGDSAPLTRKNVTISSGDWERDRAALHCGARWLAHACQLELSTGDSQLSELTLAGPGQLVCAGLVVIFLACLTTRMRSTGRWTRMVATVATTTTTTLVMATTGRVLLQRTVMATMATQSTSTQT